MSSATARAAAFSEQAAAHFNDPATAGRIFIPTGLPRDNNLNFDYESVEEAFPDVAPRLMPTGSMVLVQIRQPKLRASGLLLEVETRKTERDNTQVAKVIAIGSLAFRNRNTNEPWPEGAWCKPGDFVRVPKYQGDYFTRPYKRRDYEEDERTGRRREIVVDDVATFAQFKDLSILGIYPTAEDALAERAHL